MKREQFFEQLKSLRVPYRFTLRLNHLFLFAAWQREPFKMARLAFKFGFLQGQRAAEVEKLKMRKEELTRHASGYGHLVTIVKRHMSNEEFVRALLARARNLDKAIEELEEAQTTANHGQEGAVGHAKEA